MNFRNIGIIGSGGVGLSTAIYLSGKGYNVKIFKRNSDSFNKFKEKIENNNLLIKCEGNSEKEFLLENINIKVTNNIADLSCSDLILISIGYQSHTKNIGKIISNIGLKNSVPIIINPGKFLSTDLCNIFSNPVSETSGAIFGANIIGDSNITITNRKNGIFLSKLKNNIYNIDIVNIMNGIFGKDSSGKYTFLDEIDSVQISLSNLDYSINTVAICDNLDEILDNKIKYFNLYNLSEEYSEYFEGTYKERKLVAEKLGFNISSIYDLLSNMPDKEKSVYSLLERKFSGEKFKIFVDIYNRRFIEDTLALQKFIDFAERLGVKIPVSKKIISKIYDKKDYLKHLPIFNNYKKMNFKEKIESLKPLQDFSIEIKLKSGEGLVIENIEGKKASLQLLQNHLNGSNETSQKFDLESFCEYYEEWRKDPEGHHTTINFLNRYNEEGGSILKV